MKEEDAKRLLVVLIVFECLLVAIFAFDTFVDHGLNIVGQFFDLDGEATIPAWFSSMQLSIIALVFLLKARQPSSETVLLTVLGLGFLFLSADEAATIHESINPILAWRVEWLPRFRFNHGIWIFLYLAAAVAALLPLRRQLVALWLAYRFEASLMMTGLALFVAGGIGLEIVAYQFLGATLTPRLYPIEVAAEEFLEMSGMSVVLFGALLMLIRQPGGTEAGEV